MPYSSASSGNKSGPVSMACFQTKEGPSARATRRADGPSSPVPRLPGLLFQFFKQLFGFLGSLGLGEPIQQVLKDLDGPFLLVVLNQFLGCLKFDGRGPLGFVLIINLGALFRLGFFLRLRLLLGLFLLVRVGLLRFLLVLGFAFVLVILRRRLLTLLVAALFADFQDHAAIICILLIRNDVVAPTVLVTDS